MDALNKMKGQYLSFNRSKQIGSLSAQQAKDILAIKPQDRPISLEDNEIQRCKDKAEIKEPDLEGRESCHRHRKSRKDRTDRDSTPNGEELRRALRPASI